MQRLVTALVVFPFLITSLSPFEKICQQYYAREAGKNYTDSAVHGVVENICKNRFPPICKRYGIFLDVAVGEKYTKQRYCCTGSNHVCYSCYRVRRSPTDGVDGFQPRKRTTKFPVRGIPDRKLTKPISAVTSTGTTVTSSRATILETTAPSDEEDDGISGDEKLDTSTSYFTTTESDGVQDARDEKRTTVAVGAVAGVLAGVIIILATVIIIIHRKRVNSRRSDENGASNGFKMKPAESGAYKNNSVYGFPDPSSVGSYDGLHLYDNAGASTDVDANTYEKLSREPTREDYEKLHTYGNTLEHSGKRDVPGLKNNQQDMYANLG